MASKTTGHAEMIPVSLLVKQMGERRRRSGIDCQGESGKEQREASDGSLKGLHGRYAGDLAKPDPCGRLLNRAEPANRAHEVFRQSPHRLSTSLPIAR